MTEPPIRAVTAANFQELVLGNSRRGLVLVDFWSPRAGPSLRQVEMLSRVARELAGRFLLATLNVDEESALARRIGVHSIPTCKFYRNGEVVETLHGVQAMADYRAAIEARLGRRPAPALRGALSDWQAGDREQAIRRLADAAMEHPEDLQIPLSLAKLLVQDGRRADAHALLTAIPPAARAQVPEIGRLLAHLDLLAAAEEEGPTEGGEPEAIYRQAARLVVKDRLPEAAGRLLELHRKAPGFRQGAPRAAILALLDLLPADDPQARSLRAGLFADSH